MQILRVINMRSTTLLTLLNYSLIKFGPGYFLVFMLVIPPLVFAQEQRHAACVVQLGIPCKKANAYFVCGTTEKQIGDSLCAIHTQRGVQRFPFDLKKLHPSKHGGRCGISTYDVLCRDMPSDSNVKWFYTACLGGKRMGCQTMRDFRRFGCGTSTESIARAYCGKDNPYQAFPYFSRGGGPCGLTLFAIGCHMPIPQ
jgi:hypothetical protein